MTTLFSQLTDSGEINLPAIPQRLESLESSSPIVTRAVAAGLHGGYCNSYTFSLIQRIGLKALGRLPQSAARFVVSRIETLTGLDPKLLEGLSIERLAQERMNDYSAVQGPFPSVVVGAPLGGASAHLSLALGGPFLPQTFVTTLRGGSPDGDVQIYFQRSAELAHRIASDNPNVLTIQHYDPIHDEWMTRYVNHLRFKLLNLPPAYADFIRHNLVPGGSVCYLDCQAQWLRYRVGERSLFQVGGWGDISPQEFLEGSERIQNYCRTIRLPKSDWRLDGYPLESGPESEWGSEAGLGEAIENFCEKEGFRFVRITLSEPHDYSRLAFFAYAHLLRQEERQPAGVLIEMFSQFDAFAAIQAGLLPLWLVFNTWDSLYFLKSMRQQFPEDKPVFFSPLSSFTKTPDLVPWQDWEVALQDLNWKNIGARPTHYPADALALTNWADPLRRWVAQNRHPIHTRLEAQTLLQIAAGLSSNTTPDI
jgi:hypothetical protein